MILGEGRTFAALLHAQAVALALVGAKAVQFFRRMGGNVLGTASHLGDQPSVNDLIGAITIMLNAYEEGNIDRLFLLHNVFVSAMSQKPDKFIFVRSIRDIETAHLRNATAVIWNTQTSTILNGDLRKMAVLKEMGIEKDKPFNPDERQMEILNDAVVVGEAMAKNMVFRERLPGVLRDDGWRLIIGAVKGAEPGDAMENTQRTKYFDRFDPRARFTYEACLTSERMSFPRPGLGMGYGGMFLDTKGRALAGDRSYVINVPANPPVALFWAITVYDVDTRGLITTDQQRAERGSVHQGIKSNPDGSTPLFIGPKPPKGWEDNWIKSVPGRGWFPYFRFYGPTEPFFDQSWKLPQIEEVDYTKYAK